MKVRKLYLWKFAFILSFFALFVFLIDASNYWLTYSTLLLLLFSSLQFSVGTLKFLSFFFLLYLGLALLDISNYRGEIEFDTLQLYCFLVLLVFGIGFLFEIFCQFFFRTKNNNFRFQISLSSLQEKMMLLHFVVAFLAVALVYFTKGNVLFNQNLRFGIPTGLAYVIKSTIYIPLIYMASRSIKTKSEVFLYVFLPLVPAIMIGSRGTVVMILMSLIILKVLQNNIPKSSGLTMKAPFSRKPVLFASALGISIVYLLYYGRRLSASSGFLTPSEALSRYFYSDHWIGYILMPIHLGFKETLGLTNRIIVQKIENISSDIPLFLMDLVTVLPGKQVGAGEVMGEMFGTVEAGGLTPGLLGGLYLDFKEWSLVVILLLTLGLGILERFMKRGDSYIIFYSLSLVQFMHLFHRGFIKPEYVFAYIIILFYMCFSNYSSGQAK